MSEKDLLSMLREADIISHEPVVLRSGEESELYADVKKAYGNPELLRAMAKATLEYLNTETTCLAAAGYGGIPLGVAVSQMGNLPLSMVRDTEKNHGKRGLIDGYVPNEQDVVSLVDDVFTTGGSLLGTARAVKAQGAKVVSCHVIVARGNPKGFSLNVSYLFTPEDLV